MRHPIPEVKRFGTALIGISGLATLIFLQYTIIGVDDLGFRYVGFFYLTVPALMVAASVVALATHPTVVRWRFGREVVAIVAASLVLLAVSAPGFRVGYRGDPRVPVMVDALIADTRRDGRVVALQFPAEKWPTVVAVLEYGVHHGLPRAQPIPAGRSSSPSGSSATAQTQTARGP